MMMMIRLHQAARKPGQSTRPAVIIAGGGAWCQGTCPAAAVPWQTFSREVKAARLQPATERLGYKPSWSGSGGGAVGRSRATHSFCCCWGGEAETA